jgi:hypothetical protein
MAQFDLYIDTYSGDSVAGQATNQSAPLPKFYQGDTPTFRIFLLARTPTYPSSNPFTIINNAALSLKVALGPKDGVAGSTLFTQQFTWAKDAANTYFIAGFPLNTAAIATLLGSAPSASAWFEIEYTENGLPTTVYQQAITINAEVIETGVITVPAGATALTAEDANASFLKKDNNGFIITNANTGKRVFLYVGDDGAFHADPLS